MPASKSRDETTDWEAVFEGGENGLISLIEKAPSTAALRECTIVVIHEILRRKDDGDNKVICEKSLEEIIPADADTKTDADLETTKARIVKLLRIIKEMRKKKALDHESRKTKITTAKDEDDDAGEEAIENRLPDDTAKVFTDFYQMMVGKRSPKSPVEREIRDIIGLVLLFVGIGIIFLLFQNIQNLENIFQDTIFHQKP